MHRSRLPEIAFFYGFVLLLILTWSSFGWSASPLSLTPENHYRHTVQQATWMNPDVSPDGNYIVMDILGDIYRVPMTGGKAEVLLSGVPFESQPVYSPDGKHIAFISDRSGSNNLWVADADGRHLQQLSFANDAMVFSSPAWSADGETVYVSQMRYAMLAFHLHAYPLNGGSGYAVTTSQPNGNDGFDDRHHALGATVSPDGQYLYYAHKQGHTWSPHLKPNWSVKQRDLQSGEELPLIRAPGGAMNPALSNDGKVLAYATRSHNETTLRLRNLVTGTDRLLHAGLDPDGHEGGYYSGLLPRFAFSPDDRYLITSINGKLTKIDIAAKVAVDIPFSANLNLPLGQQTRVNVPDETGAIEVRIAQSPAVSPNKQKIAFTALGELYTTDMSGSSSPVKVPHLSRGVFQPTWSPNGQSLAYVSWHAKSGGHIWSVQPGKPPQRLTTDADYYAHPVFAEDGQHLYALRSSHAERLNRTNELSSDVNWKIISINLKSGELSTVASAFGALNLSLAKDGKHLLFYDAGAVNKVNLSSQHKQQILRITGQHMSKYIDDPSPVSMIKPRPQEDWAVVSNAAQLHLVKIPPGNGETPLVNLSSPSVPHFKLTRIGADHVNWSPDGQVLYWTVGNEHHAIEFDALLNAYGQEAEAASNTTSLAVSVPRATPQGTLLLRGATVLTMEASGDLTNADILIVDNRIAAVGPSGSIEVPEKAVVKDVSGKFILPGFVDAHAHWFDIQRGILATENHWNFLANLAHGVTSGLDVQPFTVDVFSYQDMIDAGIMIGPRAFSTGPGIFVNSHINSVEAAKGVLTRYKQYYRTHNLKSYMVGPRARRQYMVTAANALGMMPTTEGASNLRLGLTHALDGFAGNEHNLPVSPLHQDVLGLFAASQTSYTPTLTVLYGGKAGLYDFVAAHLPHTDAKVHRFMPPGLIDNKLRQTNYWQPHGDQAYPRFATDAINLQRAGGVLAVGSHGEVQGLGFLWEMEALASGDGQPEEVLYAATMGSSKAIGRDHLIGSIAPGKYADLLIMADDPRNDIRHIHSLELVMKDGKLYQADTLEEVWPQQQPAPTTWFHQADR